MTPEEMERTMQFLLNNQAAHDARLAEMEVNLNKLSQQTSDLAHTQREIQAGMLNMQGVVQSMQGVIQTTQSEFREGLQRILEVSEQTMAAVRQLAEAEARTIRRVGVLEDRIDALENPGE
jgi:ABC-type transporter Mla subunit MlaD